MIRDTLETIATGGWIMFMLGGIAFILYATAFAALAYVSRGNLNGRDADKWPHWLEDPRRAEGRMGEALRYVLHGDRLSVKIVQRRFREVQMNLIAAIDRRLLVVKTLTAAAPLAGLLGTVIGMLGMFSGLAKGGGGIDTVAAGMKEALITTQTGLTIALPGLFIILVVRARRNAIATALTQLQCLIFTTRFQRNP